LIFFYGQRVKKGIPRVIACNSRHDKESINSPGAKADENIKYQIPNEGWRPFIKIPLSLSPWAVFVNEGVNGIPPDKPALIDGRAQRIHYLTFPLLSYEFQAVDLQQRLLAIALGAHTWQGL
jgi:hypothetical protein